MTDTSPTFPIGHLGMLALLLAQAQDEVQGRLEMLESEWVAAGAVRLVDAGGPHLESLVRQELYGRPKRRR